MMKFVKMALAAVALFTFTGVAHAEGDAAKGKKTFNKCKACHKVGDKAKNGVGPQLNGIIGRKAGTVEKYKYSKLMKGASAAGMVWDVDNLRKYLDKKGMNKTLKEFIKSKGAEPKGKSKMAFAGLKKPSDRDNVIAYLATFAAK